MTTDTEAATALEARASEPFAAGNTNELLDFKLAKRRRWPFLVVGITLGVASTLGVLSYYDNEDSTDVTGNALELQLTTAPVEVRDLTEEVEWAAALGYGSPVEVTTAAPGTITSAVEAGTVLTRGDTLMTVDNEPVVLFYGDLPFWRNLSAGDEGPDVELLETNLVTLGYDPDSTVTIDDTYTANTGLMVERWREDVGAELDDTFARSDVVVAPGPVSVTSAPRVGTTATGVTASLSTRSQTITLVGQTTGEVTSIVELGTDVEHGTILYEVDGIEVMALTTLDPVTSLLFDPDSATDVENLLAFSGYDPDGAMVLDGVFDAATEAAVMRWQADVGLPQTGQTSPDAYVLVSEGFQVTAQLGVVGDELLIERPVLELALPTLSVVIPVSLAEQDEFTLGQPVSIELPDESIVTAHVVEVGTVAAQSAPGEDPTIDVVLEISEFVAPDLPASDVTVLVAGDIIENALVVPTRALVTLSEGGFAVEKVLADGQTILVAVETGTFDDGVVQVESSQLEPGDQLVVPS